MNVVITGRHFDVTEGIKSHINDKIVKLDKFYHKILEAHVILSVEKFRHVAEITVIGKQIKVTATETTSDMYASIDKAIASLEKQLRKLHDKVKEHRVKGSAGRIQEIAVRSLSAIKGVFRPEKETYGPKIVETQRVAEKPMSVEEAVEELRISNSEFIVFRSAEENRINVIYKRKDGDFGLIKT
ncbi:MAG: ribosomal subunit interface protein [Omnitrophica WOR_2 bacterium RIFCSPLOWO2_12_FULL_51_24]|nr:MAG: ribosomal subunit interface protein [Omnitrophica WOR_2 bacterium RIFCSPHIGHO2_01_FULL_49_10]OGX35837.1 MAG: ribosomal subunit interface protein [Omnitrophica WOR_2 bacterium RIFCSPLOWO2_02_FULL_50_19]OGX43623.1 MAG: ribosomal subunit interface protein [Omnitrophica WOR_2 bacterium RIFCSPLOWO2_12_FULL_51_24]